MRIVVITNLRYLGETLETGINGSGFDGEVEVLNVAALQTVTFPRPPHVVLVACPIAEGLAGMVRLRAAHPAAIVAVLSLGDRDEDFFAWARFGICGYIEADASIDTIVATLLRIAAGETVCPARLSAALLNQFARHSGRTERHDSLALLTRRELSVLELIADGLSNKQIARCLEITDATVKNHVHSVLEKMAVHSRGEAAACFRRSPAQIRSRRQDSYGMPSTGRTPGPGPTPPALPPARPPSLARHPRPAAAPALPSPAFSDRIGSEEVSEQL